MRRASSSQRSTTGPSQSPSVGRILTLVSDRRRLGGRRLRDLAVAAAAAGVDRFQLREKDLSSSALRALASEVVEALRGTGTCALVNGRPDIAFVVGAPGVQLPEQGLPPDDVKVAFPGLLVGVSCHSLAAARQAAEGGADFLLFGPVFRTPGKEDRIVGLRALEEVVRAVPVPVHAVGGIEADNVAEVWRTGCAGVAAIRAFLQDPLEAQVRRLRLGAGPEP